MNTTVAGQVLVLVILMAVGFVSFKLKITNREAASYFSSFVLKITLPCLILNSFHHAYSRELLGEAGTTIAAAFAIYGFSFLLSLAYPYILRMKGPERGVHRYALFIPNSGLVGFPVIEAVMGPLYLFHASLFNIPSHIMAFSVGIWIVAKESGKASSISRKMFLNAPIICTVAGFFMFLFSITLPAPLEKSISYVGNMTTPLSMAVIGITIAQANIKHMLGYWRVYVTVFVRLLLIPALVFIVCYFVGVRGPMLILPVIITATPAGSTTSILASVYGIAEEEAGAIVALSTMLCAITIPLVVFGLHFF